VKLVDSGGATITEPFVNGEICARGPNVMKGYWNRPADTARAIDENGWLRTGDVGYVDEDGFYYIADRVKDMIISGGENVYPAEVEEVLLDHPDITEVAVIGLPDDVWGEVVVAVATVVEGARPEVEALRSFGAERLARYKLPTRLEIVEEIPHSGAGKMLKRQLRERFDG
jgi:fatty-acyl-CoA synthase